MPWTPEPGSETPSSGGAVAPLSTASSAVSRWISSFAAASCNWRRPTCRTTNSGIWMTCTQLFMLLLLPDGDESLGTVGCGHLLPCIGGAGGDRRAIRPKSCRPGTSHLIATGRELDLAVGQELERRYRRRADLHVKRDAAPLVDEL